LVVYTTALLVDVANGVENPAYPDTG